MKNLTLSTYLLPEPVSEQVNILNILMEFSNEAFIVMDKDLYLLAYNAKAKELSGFMIAHPLMKGKNMRNLVWEERRNILEDNISKVLRGETVSYNYHGVYNDEDQFFDISYIPITNSCGQVDYVLMTGQNVTKEKKAHENLISGRNLLQKAESIAKIGSWEWDIKSDTSRFSDEFYRICGMEPGEIAATRLNGLNLLHPADRPLAESILHDTFNSGNPYDVELRLLTKDGSIRNVQCQGIVTRNELGRNEKLIGTFHDITEIKQLQETIAETQKKYKYLVEHSADVLLQVNEKTEIIFASPSVYESLGYTPEEITGKRLGSIAADEDLPLLLINYQAMLATNALPVTLEYRVKKKDGSLLWVEGTLNNLFQEESINSVVINQRDITHRKEAESLLKSLNEHLVQKARQLELSNAELEKFAYVASHDLQQPLRTVKSFLEMLQKSYAQLLDEKANEYIDFAVDGAERMKRLINALLEYSRQGNRKPELEKIDMNTKMENMLRMFQKSIQESGAEITYAKLPEIWADRMQTTQLLQNLVGNALKFHNGKASRVNISCKDEKTHWKFCMADNGIGIALKDRERIFEIFQRLKTGKEYEGSGIGLSISKKIVEAHGGKIWVENNEPAGSKFYFTLRKP